MDTELTTEEIRVLTEYVRRSLIDYLKEDRYEANPSFDDVGKIYLAYFKLKQQMSEKLGLQQMSEKLGLQSERIIGERKDEVGK